MRPLKPNGTKIRVSNKVETVANSRLKPFSVGDGVLLLVAARVDKLWGGVFALAVRGVLNVLVRVCEQSIQVVVLRTSITRATAAPVAILNKAPILASGNPQPGAWFVDWG